MAVAYSGCGWAPPYLCVWSGHLAAGRFLCTAPVALCTAEVVAWVYSARAVGLNGRGVSCSACALVLLWRVLRAAGPSGRGASWVRLGRGIFFVRPGSYCGLRILCVVKPCCSVRGQALLRGVFCVRLRPGGVARILCAALGFPVCYEVDNSPLFNFTRIFPPFPGACRNLAQKPLICGYNAYA